MISTGNDIVALSSINKERTCEHRFYSKILSESEQSLYQQPELKQVPFEIFVWLLWSVKESAYKFLKRFNPEFLFSPTKIIINSILVSQSLSVKECEGSWESSISDNDLYSGTVQSGSQTLYFQSKITTSWIASVVNSAESFEDVCWGVRMIDDASRAHQSKAAREALLEKLNEIFPGELETKKGNSGYPIIFKNKTATSIPASLAHDGHFIAYAFLLNLTAEVC